MLIQIQSSLAGLTRAERKVAEWILEHPKQASESTLAEVALASTTSEPSVIRFCRRLGLAGFRELVIRLTESLSQPDSYVHRDVTADDATSDAVVKVIDASIRSIIDVRAQLSGMPFDAAVSVLAGARQHVFTGIGASGHVASDACHKFFRLGTPCAALTDLPGIRQFSAISRKGDAIVVISKAGNSTPFCDAARAAQQNGAAIIAVTERDSMLARLADLCFACDSQEDTSVYTPMSSRLVHLAVLDALQVALALRLGASAAENLRRSKAALRSTV